MEGYGCRPLLSLDPSDGRQQLHLSLEQHVSSAQEHLHAITLHFPVFFQCAATGDAQDLQAWLTKDFRGC